MSLVRISFDVEGEQQISRAFEALAVETSDMSEPLEEMADLILDYIRLQFESEGASGLGEKWVPLDPDYEARKAVHYPGRPILVRTGGMKGAMLNKAQAVRVTPSRMVYEPKGEGGVRAARHQRGHNAGEDHPHLPQRKIIALTTAQKRTAVDRTFSAWLTRVRREAQGA